MFKTSCHIDGGLSIFAGICLGLMLVAVGCEGAAVSEQVGANDQPKFVPEDSDSDGNDDTTANDGQTQQNQEEVKPAPPAKATGEEKPAKPQTNEDGKPEADSKPDGDDKKPEPDNKNPQEDGDDLIDPDHPFPRQLPIPDFPKDMAWINSRPLRMADLKGKFVLVDFWTYCCINCIHVLPELKKLEKAYPNNLVVIGVHSAKFETEKDSKNIREAVLRYEIEHPVINDHEHQVWNTFGVRSWPTLLMIDPQGNAVWGKGGETKFEEVDALLKRALPYYREKKLLDESPVRFELAAHEAEETPLRFPGKVLADETGDRLFISDSNHNRIVIVTLDGELIETIGSGAIGKEDGDFATCSFDHPQGMALHGETLYLADTENHLLRKIDLKKKTVTTIAGIGEQGRNAWPGLDALGPLATVEDIPERWVGEPLKTGINSPWALWVHEKDLYIAMAGPHQIWKMPLDESEIGPYAGNGREDIVDGPLLPKRPYDEGFSSFAQPSGLASDGTWLFVADSEGSSIRAVPFDPEKEVRTVVGTADEEFGRLFKFGFEDGAADKALLQHALGVVYHEGKIYTADTYNNAIRVVDAESGEVATLAGVREMRKVKQFNPITRTEQEVEQAYGKPGASDEEGTFDEPAGITYAKGRLYIADTNNHLIRTIDLATTKVGTLNINGLKPPAPPKQERKPTFPGAAQVKVDEAALKPVDGQIKLAVELKLPVGWKINELAPAGYLLEADGEKGIVDRTQVGKFVRQAKPAAKFDVRVPVTGAGSDMVKLSMNYYYCQEGDQGLCKIGAVVFTVPIKVDDAAKATSVSLVHKVTN